MICVKCGKAWPCDCKEAYAIPSRSESAKAIAPVGNSSGMQSLTSGLSVDWPTPDDFFDALDAEFGPFTLDPATALGYHTSDVILARGGRVVTLEGVYENGTDEFRPYLGTRPFEVEDVDGESLPGDGLVYEWTGRVWLNHPYGREDWRWMKKAHDSVRFGDAEIVVALVPAKTQMKWWHKYVGATEVRALSSTPHMTVSENVYPFKENKYSPRSYYEINASVGKSGADVIRFVRGRLRFGGAPSSAPFNSAVIVWRK